MCGGAAAVLGAAVPALAGGGVAPGCCGDEHGTAAWSTIQANDNMPVPSAFRGHCVESDHAQPDAVAVRSSFVPCLLLLAACQGAGAAAPGLAPPGVPLVVAWPEGARFTTALAREVPDELPWRAAAVWWREALRQTVRFQLDEADAPSAPGRAAAVLELGIDPAAGTVLATLLDADGRHILAGDRFAAGQLPAAIDRLAWAARLALGEDALRPLPVAPGTSADPVVVLAAEDARALLRDGGVQSAARVLRDARARDGASPFVLDGTAALQLLRGELAAAERTALEALGYTDRLLPTTRHRLARTLLLTRASLLPEQATQRDQDLLQLGTVMQRERPHDPEAALSIGIAHNFLADFVAARAVLEPIERQLPNQAIVPYHLGWACLATGDPARAVVLFERAAVRLPPAWLLLPRAIAMHEAGQHEALLRLLQELRADPDGEGRDLQHELLAMLAAQALLRGDVAAARTHLQADLDWLASHPLLLPQRLGEFAERGAVLIRLGGGERLPSLLAAVQAQHASTPVADACAFLAGMLDVQRTGARALVHEQALARGGDSLFGALLVAYAHERRGEIADMQAALARAARLSSSPLTKALLARGLRSSGKIAEGDRLRATLRTEMRTFRMRQPCRHPLLGPELAYAYDLE